MRVTALGQTEVFAGTMDVVWVLVECDLSKQGNFKGDP